MHQKAEVGDASGKWRWSGGRHSESSPFGRVDRQDRHVWAQFRQTYPALLKLASLKKQHHSFLAEIKHSHQDGKSKHRRDAACYVSGSTYW